MWGQEPTQGPGRGRSRDWGAEKEETTAGARTHTQEGHTTTEGPSPPHPKRTPHDSRRRTPLTHAVGARIGRRRDQTGTRPPATGNHTGDGGYTYTGRTGYTHRGSGWEHRRAAHHHTLTARRQPRPPQGPPHRHQKRTKARPQHPGLGTRTPRGHGTTAQAPREGNPTDTYPITSPSGTPRPPQHGPSEPPTPNCTLQPPASHTLTHTLHRDTGQADLHRPITAQHEAARHTAPQCATEQSTTTRHAKAKNAVARRDATRHRAAHHGTADPNLKD